MSVESRLLWLAKLVPMGTWLSSRLSQVSDEVLHKRVTDTRYTIYTYHSLWAVLIVGSPAISERLENVTVLEPTVFIPGLPLIVTVQI